MGRIGSSKKAIKNPADKIGVIKIKGATKEASAFCNALIQNRYEIPLRRTPLMTINNHSFAVGKTKDEKVSIEIKA